MSNFKYAQNDLLFYILIPVYNVEKYIKNCIDSVLNQTYKNFKVIIVDDGTPDNAGKICDEYAKKDDRIMVIHQKNAGLLSARQTAIKNVLRILKEDEISKSYIIYLDSDDSLKETALYEINKAVSNNNESDMVIYGYDRVLNDIIIQPYNNQDNYEGIVEDKKNLYNIVFNNSAYNSLCRKAVKATLISNIDYGQYFHISHAEDLLQSLVFYKNSKKVLFLNKSLYNYTINEGSITQSVNAKNFEINFEVRQKVMEFLKSENVFNNDDWNRYRGYCIYIIINTILTISNFDIKLSEKKELYSEIQNSIYYIQYLKDKSFNREAIGKNIIIYNLFKYKLFFLIDVLSKCNNFIKNRKDSNK